MFNRASSFPLPDNLKEVFTPYFSDHDLSRVTIHLSMPWYVRKFAKVTPGAYTSGNKIYFAPGHYDPNTVNGIASIAHELTHIQQYREYGKFRFRLKYLAFFFKNKSRQLEDAEAYKGIPFEKEAYDKQQEIKKYLETEVMN